MHLIQAPEWSTNWSAHYVIPISDTFDLRAATLVLSERDILRLLQYGHFHQSDKERLMIKRRAFLMGGTMSALSMVTTESFARRGPSQMRKSATPAWAIEGVAMENCSCRYFCVCNLGAVELPDGWHAGTCVYDIRTGESAGVDLSGTTIVATYVMPGGFAEGNGTGRTYIGDTASPDQHRELNAIFNGERGGVFASFRATMAKPLPTQTVGISLSGDEAPRVKIGSIGEVTLRRLKTASGKPTTLNNAVYQEPFGIEYEELCDSTGSYCADPAMRNWRGGAGGIAKFKIRSANG